MVLKWSASVSLLTDVLRLLSTVTRILDPCEERGFGERVTKGSGKKKNGKQSLRDSKRGGGALYSGFIFKWFKLGKKTISQISKSVQLFP